MNRRRLLAACAAAAAGVVADAVALNVIMRIALADGVALTREGLEFIVFYFLLFGWPLAVMVALPAVSLYERARARGKAISQRVALTGCALVGGASLALTWVVAWGGDSEGPAAAAASGAIGGIVLGVSYLQLRGTDEVPHD